MMNMMNMMPPNMGNPMMNPMGMGMPFFVPHFGLGPNDSMNMFNSMLNIFNNNSFMNNSQSLIGEFPGPRNRAPSPFIFERRENNLMRNNMGMNNMMNNMMMNNMMLNNQTMIPIGMNQMEMNTINLDDQTTFNIKSIVKPYEDKIKKLEDLIRKKDFEITVLKHKLNKFNSNNSNNSFMKIKPIMNPLLTDGNFEHQTEIKRKRINVHLVLDNNTYKVKCSPLDKVSLINNKFNLNGKCLTYYFKGLLEDFTFQENGIFDNYVIHAKSVMNVIFKDDFGKKLNLILSKDCPVNLAIIYYLLESQKVHELFNSKFIYNGKNLNLSDQTPIKFIFQNPNNPQVFVFTSNF